MVDLIYMLVTCCVLCLRCFRVTIYYCLWLVTYTCIWVEVYITCLPEYWLPPIECETAPRATILILSEIYFFPSLALHRSREFAVPSLIGLSTRFFFQAWFTLMLRLVPLTRSYTFWCLIKAFTSTTDYQNSANCSFGLYQRINDSSTFFTFCQSYGFCVPVDLFLRMTHIPLSICGIIESLVGSRRMRDSRMEDIGMVRETLERHILPITPS